MDYGIDVSHFNAIADAHAVRNNGITYAWVKATEGTNYVDPTFANKVKQLRAAGIRVGAYHFLRAGDAAAQARHFRDVAGDAGCLALGSLMPMADLESVDVRGTANPALIAFYDKLGVSPLDCYGNLDWWVTTLQPGRWSNRTILGHIARYNGKPGAPGWTYSRMACHQHSSTGTVPGIPGHVDRNATMAGYNLQAITIGNVPVPRPIPASPVVPPATHPPATSTTKDTYVVRSGDTLSRIASMWHVTVSAVAVANRIADPDVIQVGQILKRPGAPGAATATPASKSYTVRPGDTLSALARVLGRSVPTLVALNHLSNPDRIYAGQVIHY
ncbi:LysM peptidoglycan-binding domain-containing protein [Labedaea rhizosphaerae]|uniref:Lysozyme n=1 Tax=Labedaea rhizosphaerae TaxID=598644 RepID=A0A4R6SHW0_LABRH|nr:LysM peptidoglycan-binding domain-containing protein [Labedaea rhizosphaerae]TDQ01233.1 lysozyme [Labedaea rhizosphaerae]